MKNIQKQTLTIGILGTLIALSVYVTGAVVLAQDSSTMSTSLTIDNDCTWDGVPYSSNLTVADGDTCLIIGDTKAATSVTIAADDGFGGGTLTVGGSGVSTDFTVSGLTDNQGNIYVGITGNPNVTSQYITSAANVNVRGGGVFTVVANSVGTHELTVDGDLNLGNVSTSGSLVNNHTVNVKETVTLDTASSLTNNSGGTINIEADIAPYTANDLLVYDTSTVTNNNGGTINVYDMFWLGDTSLDTPTVSNSGQINAYNNVLVYYNSVFDNNSTGTFSVIGIAGVYLFSNSTNAADTPEFNNDGVLTANILQVGDTSNSQTATFTNDTATGSVTLNTLSILTNGVVNNNSGTLKFEVNDSTGFNGSPGNLAILNNNDDSFDIKSSVTTCFDATITNVGTMTVENKGGGTSFVVDAACTIENSGTLNITNSSLLTYLYVKVNGIINNTGTINLYSGSIYSYFAIAGNLNNQTGGIFTVNDPNNAGVSTIYSMGTLDNDNILDIDSSFTIAGILNNSGDIDIGGSGDVEILTVNGGGSLVNTATGGDLLEVWGDLDMNYNSDWDNDGDARIRGNLDMDLLSSSAPILTNDGYINIEGEPADYDNNKFLISNSSSVINNASGKIKVMDNVELADTSTFSNYGKLHIGWNEGTVSSEGSATNALWVNDDTEFTNYTGGEVILDPNGASILDGQIDVDSFSQTPVFTNNAYVRASNLSINNASSFDTAIFNNNSGATLIADYDGTSFSAIEIYDDGQLLINSGSTLFRSDGEVLVDGTNAIFTADADVTINGKLHVIDNGAVTFSGTTNTIESLEMQSPSAGSSTFTVDTGATLQISDSHTGCFGAPTGNCAMEVGTVAAIGDSLLTVNGTLNIPEVTGDVDMIFGDSSAGAGGLTIGIDGFVNIDETGGEFNIGATEPYGLNDNSDNSLTEGLDIEMPANITGYATVGNRFDLKDTLHVTTGSDSNGHLGVEDDAAITVENSTTLVDGEFALDGILNAGELTVSSTGWIYSGGGVGQDQTSFLINADSLDVQTDGRISSDGVSSKHSSHVGAGSHGGEGEGRTGPGITYGLLKADISDLPLYGEAGRTLSPAIDGKGGGGVRIYVEGDAVTAGHGDIIINGTVSANGADSTNTLGGAGAGGTVIIEQNITNPDAVFTGTGTISANGGGSTVSGVPVGGGGRVILYSYLIDDPDFGSYDFGEAPSPGTVQALPGHGDNGTPVVPGDDTYAAAGTITYAGDLHNDNGSVIVDQNNTPATSGEVTEIPDPQGGEGGGVSDWTFALLEARNGAIVEIDEVSNQMPEPEVCYETPYGGSSDVEDAAIACNPYPSKPDTLYVNTTITTAQSGDEPGYIAGKGNGVSNTALTVTDSRPEFSAIFRNPGVDPAITSHRYVEIIVADDSAFSNIIWDATGVNRIDLGVGNEVDDGERTRDIEYNENSTATVPNLATDGTTYYVAMWFRDKDNLADGLATFGDYNDQYKFQISEFGDIWIDNCNNGLDSLKITQDGTGGGADLSMLTASQYGYGTCDVHVGTSYPNWEVRYGKATGEELTGFDDGFLNEIAEINNTGGTDCSIAGNDNSNEYGYNIVTINGGSADDQEMHDNVTTNVDCGAYNVLTNYFNIEDEGSEDLIVDVNSGNPVNDAEFELNVHANVNSSVAAGSYDIGTTVTLTTSP